MKKLGNPNINKYSVPFKPGNEEWKKRRLFRHGLAEFLKRKEIKIQFERQEIAEDGTITKKKVDKRIKYTDDLYAIVLQSILQKAVSGDEWAQNKVLEMIDGKTPDRHQIAGDPDNPAPVQVIRIPSMRSPEEPLRGDPREVQPKG